MGYTSIDLDDDVSLGTARKWLRGAYEEGAICPCCRQVVKLYKRKLNSNMGAAMIALYIADEHDAGGWIHLKNYLLQRKRYFSDAPALRHWGLIEEKPEELEDGNPRAGFYRITKLGRSFVRGEVSVIKHTYQYNKTILTRDLPDRTETTIQESLGDKFNYKELMAAAPDGSGSSHREGIF